MRLPLGTLKYLYVGVGDFPQTLEYYRKPLGARLVWWFRAFDTEVAAVELGALVAAYVDTESEGAVRPDDQVFCHPPPNQTKKAITWCPVAADMATPLVALIMGSSSDWDTMSAAAEVLEGLGIPHEARVVSAHRTPDFLFEYVGAAEGRGIQVIIAGAGGAAHLPGMAAAKTTLPVLGVPVQSKALSGLDSLLSIVQMPRGVPVATLAIGKAGAANAALLAAEILALQDAALRDRLKSMRDAERDRVLGEEL